MRSLATRKLVILFTSLHFAVWVTCEGDDLKDISDSCLDGLYHERAPKSEPNLLGECTPWQNRACCSANTTKNILKMSSYNFNFDHCSHDNRTLSPQCKRHFQRDLCFYECDPNIRPWVLKIKMKHRNERFFKVPLCASECDAWFKACKDDYTCAKNWVTDFKWNQTNKCVSRCITFKEMYGSAQNFCEQVWDHSWQYTPDNEPCMKLSFNSTDGNPNVAVFLHKVNWFHKATSYSLLNIFYIVCAFILMLISFFSILYLKIKQRRRTRIIW